MTRLRIAAIVAATVLGIGAAGSAMAAAPALPKGTLTSLEYTQLRAMYAGLLSPSNATNWTRLTAACDKAGTSTPLLSTQRSSCVAELNTLAYIGTLSTSEKKCDTAIAARAGAAATTVQNLAALQAVACLNSDYQQLSHLAVLSYDQTVAARNIALARGFTGVCLSTLVDTPSQLRVTHAFTASVQQLAQDAAGLTKLADRRGVPTNAEMVQFQDDSAAFGAAFEAMTKLTGPTKLSVCPHQ